MSMSVGSVVADFSAVDIDARLTVSGLGDNVAVGDEVTVGDEAGNTCAGRVASRTEAGAGVVELELTSWVSA